MVLRDTPVVRAMALIGTPCPASSMIWRLSASRNCAPSHWMRSARVRVAGRRRGRPRTSTRAWIFVVRPPRECELHWPAPPFCATGRAMGLDVAAIDLTRFRDPAFLRQRRQDARPDAPAAPPVPSIIDRRRRAVFGRTIRPAATALQHVDDAQDHSPIIDPPRSELVLRQVRLDRSPCFIRQAEQRTRYRQRPPAAAETL